MSQFDIRRQIREANSDFGGVTTTSTAIESRYIDLQHITVKGARDRFLGSEIVDFGGLRVESLHRGFCSEDSNLREFDQISKDSGTTRYEIVFVQTGWAEHIEFLAKKVN